MSKKNKLLSIIPAVLGILLTIGVLTAFRACAMKDDGTWMHCHMAQNDAAIGGVIICLLFLAAAFIKNRTAATVLRIAGIIAGIVTALIPGTIVSMCMMNTMRCYAVMQPFVRVMAVLVIIFGVISIMISRGQGESCS